MPDTITTKKKADIVENVSASTSAPTFECGVHGHKTKDITKHLEHLNGPDHVMLQGNYPCPVCKRMVTIVPDYIDAPAPDSELPEDNTKNVHKKFLMVSKRPEQTDVNTKFAPCDDCRKELLKRLAK